MVSARTVHGNLASPAALTMLPKRQNLQELKMHHCMHVHQYIQFTCIGTTLIKSALLRLFMHLNPWWDLAYKHKKWNFSSGKNISFGKPCIVFLSFASQKWIVCTFTFRFSLTLPSGLNLLHSPSKATIPQGTPILQLGTLWHSQCTSKWTGSYLSCTANALLEQCSSLLAYLIPQLRWLYRYVSSDPSNHPVK